MRAFKFIGVVSIVMGTLVFSAQGFAAQWVTNVNATQAIVGNSSGQYVQILTSDTIVNPASCPNADSYVVHDAALVSSALAISLTAIASGRTLRVFVTDACDAATGRPLAISIGLM
jgi:hypothetical protein